MLALPSSTQDEGITRVQELRFLPAWAISNLSRIMEGTPGWRDIMALIPGDPWKSGESIPEGLQYMKKYTREDIDTISEECSRCRREGFEVLVQEWGTSGRQRPTVQDLALLLQKVSLNRALHYLTVTVLKEEAIPSSDRSNTVDILDHFLENERSHENVVFGTSLLEVMDAPTGNSHEEAFNGFGSTIKLEDNESIYGIEGRDAPTSTGGKESFVLDAEILQGMDCLNVPHFSYVGLKRLTNDFSEVPYSDGGNKLGEGAFGKVYFGHMMQQGIERKVAVKRITAVESSEFQLEKQFKTEVEVLSRCKHENLVPLEGFSCDGPEWCLVYTFMPCGSLMDALSCVDGKEPLNWRTRISIGEGSARGIVYLHTFRDPPLVHRDIKSANILLDEHMIPKVGDFGLVRPGSKGLHSKTIVKGSSMFGTLPYMAPEALRSDISVKMDTFSFGVVMLEILTGLFACDEDREEADLISHVSLAMESESGIDGLVDTAAGSWNMDIFKGLLDLAVLCGEKKRKRPSMFEVLEKYSAIVQSMG